MNVLKIYNKHVRLLQSISCVIFLLFLSDSAWSEQQLNDVSTPLDINQIFSVFLGLGFVLLLFFVLVFALKKLPAVGGAQAGIIKIIDTLYLSNTEKIVLIKIGEQQLLLGVTGQKIETLTEVDGKFESTDQNSQSSIKSFSQIIAEKILTNGKKT